MRSTGLSRAWWYWMSRITNMRGWLFHDPGRLLKRKKNPWQHLEDPDQYKTLLEQYPLPPPEKCTFTIGILKDIEGRYKQIVQACEELCAPYQLLEFCSDAWIEDVRSSRCHGYICHPSFSSSPWKALYEERLTVLACALKRPVHPDVHGLWLYESKRRMAYWLSAHQIPHPQTRVFYDRDAAFAFAATAIYPIVVKTDLGSGADGVYLVRKAAEAYRLIARAFSSGLRGRLRDYRDREWGSILFQKYIPNAREFRVIQIGDSWFAHEKLPDERTGKHSGSGKAAWTIPPDTVFDFCLAVSRQGHFRSMNYDIFMDNVGRILVNELQTFFAAYNPSQMYRNGVPGRMRHTGSGWRFEEGLFCRNGCANLRVETLLEDIRAAGAQPGACGKRSEGEAI